jgi:putative two-component system response regulator
LEQVTAHLNEQRAKHFDPNLVDLFLACMPEVEAIRLRWQEC